MTSNEIIEFGIEINKKMHDFHFLNKNDLIINLKQEDFVALDQDLYYRQEHDENDKFIPSEDEINLSFDKLNIKFIKM